MISDEEKLRVAFCDALGVPKDINFESVSYRGTKEWDSVAHMQLVGAIEAAFDVMLDSDDVIGLSTFEKAREILRKHGATT